MQEQAMYEIKQQYLTEKELSQLTGISLSTLRNNRFLGKGLIYCKIGRSVRYALNDIHEYMEKHKIEPRNSGSI